MQIGKRPLLFCVFALSCAEGARMDGDIESKPRLNYGQVNDEFTNLETLPPKDHLAALEEIRRHVERLDNVVEITESQRTALEHRITNEAANGEVKLALHLLNDYLTPICELLPINRRDETQKKAFIEALDRWKDSQVIATTVAFQRYRALSYGSIDRGFKNLISETQRAALLKHKDAIVRAYYFIIPPDSDDKEPLEDESLPNPLKDIPLAKLCDLKGLVVSVIRTILKAEGKLSFPVEVKWFSDEAIIICSENVSDAELLSNYLPPSPQSDPTIAHAILNFIMGKLRAELDNLARAAEAKDLLARIYAVPVDKRSEKVNSAITELEPKGVTVSSIKWVWRIGITLCVLALLACGLYFALGKGPKPWNQPHCGESQDEV